MAVLVEGISVIVRVDRVAKIVRGGCQRLLDECPNDTLCSDSELIRVGFMSPDDVEHYVDQLGRLGLQYLSSGIPVDIIVVDQQQGPATKCDWVDFGHINFEGDPGKRVAACRLAGSQVKQLYMPDGWTYDRSLTLRFRFVESRCLPESMEFLRHEDGFDVYRDLRTGKEMIVGRTRA